MAEPFKPHLRQYEFLNATEQVVWACGGRGSGKTWVGALWVVLQCCKYPGAMGICCANNPSQCIDPVLKAITQLLDQIGIEWVWGEAPPWGGSRFQSHVNILSVRTGAQVRMASLANYDTAIRGKQASWAWVDEARDNPSSEALEVLMGCLRDPDAPNQCRITSTPNGYDWMYDLFVAEGRRFKDSRVISMPTCDNQGNLPPGFIEGLQALYGASFARQELEGQIVNISEGRVYEFSRDQHVAKVTPWQEMPVYLGLDYNLNPLAGVVMQIDKRNRIVQVLDEIRMDSGKTRDACIEFARRLLAGNYGDPSRIPVVDFIGDAAGSAGDTRGTVSDHDIMKAVLRDQLPRHKVNARFSTKPRVVDRVNSVNALLKPYKGGTRMTVDPKCHNLIRDLEQVSWKPGELKIEKEKNKNLTHFVDALGYGIFESLPCTAGPAMSGWSPQDARAPVLNR